jgi:hypothetical protein
MNSPMGAIHRHTVGVVMGTASVLGRLVGEARVVSIRTLRQLGLNGTPGGPSGPPPRTLRLVGQDASDESVAGDGGGVNVERALKLVGVWDPAELRSGSGADEAIHRRQQRRR